MTTVFVVMGNDVVDAVFSTEAAAEAYCERMREKDRERIRTGEKPSYWRGIYWRAREYELDGELA